MATVDWQSQDGGDGMDEEVSTFEPPHISVKVKDPATEGSGYLQKYTVYTLTTKVRGHTVAANRAHAACVLTDNIRPLQVGRIDC